jgi:hypothetical protein
VAGVLWEGGPPAAMRSGRMGARQTAALGYHGPNGTQAGPANSPQLRVLERPLAWRVRPQVRQRERAVARSLRVLWWVYG